MTAILGALTQFRTRESESYESGNLHSSRNYQRIPFFASPLDPKAQDWLNKKQVRTDGKLQRAGTTLVDFEAEHDDSKLARSVFVKQHEASTLELFYDLFFVANLAAFTDQHAHVDGPTVANYIGFFFILWTTWYHQCIYDVRFFVDCVWMRWCKLFAFAVMTTFAGLTPIYESVASGAESRSFQGIALVLMASRLMLLLQYAVLYYFVRGFKKTMIPCILMMFIYLASAMAFLGTRLENSASRLSGAEGARHIDAWYAILAVELVATLVVSSIWKILSFKHTHIVERAGLLTLIIIGEGILGFIKGVVYLLLGTEVAVWSKIGVLWSCVMLLYLIYVLYFDNIAEDRFGTIRQQIWLILHLPLHIAILLVVEGNTALSGWDACMSARRWILGNLPSLSVPSIGYADLSEYINHMNETVIQTGKIFHYEKLEDYYNVEPDLEKTMAINATFGSTEWNEKASEILNDTFSYLQYFIFNNYQVEASKEAEEEPDPILKVSYYYDAYKTAFIYFFTAAGAMLLILAVMFWFGKKRKNRFEYFGILARVIVGIGIPFLSFLTNDENEMSGFMYKDSAWTIPILLFCLLGILIADNIIKTIAYRQEKKRALADSVGEKGLDYDKSHKLSSTPMVSEGYSEAASHASPTRSPDGIDATIHDQFGNK